MIVSFAGAPPEFVFSCVKLERSNALIRPAGSGRRVSSTLSHGEFCHTRNKVALQKKRAPVCLCASAHAAQDTMVTAMFSDKAVAKIVSIVGDKVQSGMGQASWEDVMRHTAQRLSWVSEAYEMIVMNERALTTDDKCQAIVKTADICIVVSVHKHDSVNWILKHSASVTNMLCFDTSCDIKVRLGGVGLVSNDLIMKVRSALPGSAVREALNVINLVEEAWKRRSSDDIRFVLLILIDKYVSPVECLQSLRANDLNALKCMLSNCGPQVLACLLDPTCRQAVSCLNSCAPTDQVCSYQCIASYESPELEAFSLCVLQKHNCLGLTAKIPQLPTVQPLKSFRGKPLSHAVSEDIFVGWLEKLHWSWRVAAGQNPAYDQFPCQFQIFYRGRAKGSMWYDPVFQVKTLDGRFVWRRRHYRVKRGHHPGTFFFSVLDNGVVSKEYWRIVDVADNLAWGLFFYSGAAAAAGQSYSGAVLVTPDGQWPMDSEIDRVNSALEKCGIKDWEMYTVNNAACESPPLGIPEVAGLQPTSLWE